MNQQELEDLFIRSLDVPMNAEEKEKFLKDLGAHPELAKQFSQHKRVRELLERKAPASFGPFFPSRIVNVIQNSGVVIDRQIFSFFKKFQLAALGVVVALIILNVIFSDQISLTTILGLEKTVVTQEEEIVSFDFFKNFK